MTDRVALVSGVTVLKREDSADIALQFSQSGSEDTFTVVVKQSDIGPMLADIADKRTDYVVIRDGDAVRVELQLTIPVHEGKLSTPLTIPDRFHANVGQP